MTTHRKSTSLRLAPAVTGAVALIAGVLAVSPAVSDVTWGPATTVAPEGLSYSSAATSADGRVVTLVGLNPRASTPQAVTSVDRGISWGTPVTLAPDSNTGSGGDVASSADGRTLWAAWTSAGMAVRIARSTDAGAHWGAAVELAPKGRSPRVATSADGRTVIVGFQRSEGLGSVSVERSSTDGGATWDEPNLMSDPQQFTSSVDVVTSDDGARTTAIWSGAPATGGAATVQSRASVDGGAHWSSTRTISGPTASRGPQMAASTDGMRLAATWVDYADPEHPVAQVAVSSDGGAAWSTPKDLSSRASSAQIPTVTASRDGRTIAVGWTTYANTEPLPSDHVVHVASTTDGGATWRDTQDLAPPVETDPGVWLAMSPGGRTIAAVWRPWISGQQAVTYRMSSDRGASFEPAQDLVTGTVEAPHFVFTGGDALVAFWNVYTGSAWPRQVSVGAVPVPDLSAEAVTFGGHVVSTAVERRVPVSNPGTAPLTIADVSVEGAAADQFAITGTSCTTVAPGQTCTLTVRFAPTSIGEKSARLQFVDNTDPGSHAVALSGAGVTVPATRLAVKASSAKRIPYGKRRVLVTSVTTDGTATVKATCTVKGKKRPARLCGLRVKRTTVSAKPTCSKGLRIGVLITAQAPGASVSTWKRTWTVKARPPVKCRAN